GLYFGKKMGEFLKSNEIQIDALIPVPLHHRKQFKRGFNQAECIAKGIQQATDVKLDLKSIKRAVFTDSQTKKSLVSRWENMKNKFVISDSIKQYNHIALVDDVITTGSTLEAIIVEIRKVHPEIKISILSLAVTR
ncbi:MAG: ComF family protein, partial [Fluviicola sp.]